MKQKNSEKASRKGARLLFLRKNDKFSFFETNFDANKAIRTSATSICRFYDIKVEIKVLRPRFFSRKVPISSKTTSFWSFRKIFDTKISVLERGTPIFTFDRVEIKDKYQNAPL